jgi:DHA2 family multidrug resistance protein
LIAHISPFNPALPPYLAAQGLDPRSPATVVGMAQEIARQAQMLAFVDLFWFIGVGTLAILPLG